MYFEIPLGYRGKSVEIDIPGDNERTLIFENNHEIFNQVAFEVIQVDSSYVIASLYDNKTIRFLNEWRCNSDPRKYIAGIKLIGDYILKPLSKVVKTGVIMSTFTTINNSSLAFFVSSNAYVMDIDWPFCDLKTLNYEMINEACFFNSDFRYLFKCLKDHYTALSKNMMDSVELHLDKGVKNED